jgi:hypothetical protein
MLQHRESRRKLHTHTHTCKLLCEPRRSRAKAGDMKNLFRACAVVLTLLLFHRPGWACDLAAGQHNCPRQFPICFQNGCYAVCQTPGFRSLRIGGFQTGIFANKPTNPAIHIQTPAGVCYLPLTARGVVSVLNQAGAMVVEMPGSVQYQVPLHMAS